MVKLINDNKKKVLEKTNTKLVKIISDRMEEDPGLYDILEDLLESKEYTRNEIFDSVLEYSGGISDGDYLRRLVHLIYRVDLGLTSK